MMIEHLKEQLHFSTESLRNALKYFAKENVQEVRQRLKRIQKRLQGV